MYSVYPLLSFFLWLIPVCFILSKEKVEEKERREEEHRMFVPRRGFLCNVDTSHLNINSPRILDLWSYIMHISRNCSYKGALWIILLGEGGGGGGLDRPILDHFKREFCGGGWGKEGKGVMSLLAPPLLHHWSAHVFQSKNSKNTFLLKYSDTEILTPLYIRMHVYTFECQYLYYQVEGLENPIAVLTDLDYSVSTPEFDVSTPEVDGSSVKPTDTKNREVCPLICIHILFH